MNVEIGTEAAQFPEKEYIHGIFVAVQGLRSREDTMYRKRERLPSLIQGLWVFFSIMNVLY
jgi:hypothetical protein